MLRTRIWIVAALVLIPMFTVADDGDSKKDRAAKPPAKLARGKKNSLKRPVEITREEEKAATVFVKAHHEELLELLIHLKEGLPQEYKKAIRDLARTSNRLETLASRDESRYKIELKLWQAKSRRQLLTARFQMSRDDSLIQEIRETLQDEQQFQTAILKHERDRLAARVKKLSAQLERQEKTQEDSIERQISTLIKGSKTNNRKVKAGKRKKPAAKKEKPT